MTQFYFMIYLKFETNVGKTKLFNLKDGSAEQKYLHIKLVF